MTEAQPEFRAPIVRVGQDDVPILFVNDFVVQHHAAEFFITFSQVQPPIIIGTPEERREQARHITSVPARVVVRIGLTPHRMTELIRVLQANLQMYEQQRGTQP